MHTDSCYRQRYQIYHVPGKQWDSRHVNWRTVKWEDVIQIDTIIRDNKHSFELRDKPYSLGFLCFRWAGAHKVFNNGKPEDMPIRIWTVGYIFQTGKCLLTDIDFKTGNVIKQYDDHVSRYSSHVHPRLKCSKLHGKIIHA